MKRVYAASLLLLFILVTIFVTSAGSAPPGQSSPVNTSPPSVGGAASVGSTLSASSGSWSGPSASYSYQWQRCDSSGGGCGSVAGATGSSYTIGSGDAGHTFRVTVTATNKNGSTVASSGASGAVPAPAPTPSPTTTTTRAATATTTSATTATTTTSATTSSTASASGFSTSLVDGATITTPYTWTFDPGVPTVAGYFWADGVLLKKVSGPGPYTLSLAEGALADGAHQLGHAWDLADATHDAPPSAYDVTIANPTTTTTTAAAGSGTVYFDGRAQIMSALYSYETSPGALSTLVHGQSPTLWDCLCFLDNSMSLQADSRYGKIFKNYVGPGDRNPWNTAAPASNAAGQVSKIRSNDFGKWDWYATTAMIPSGGWNHPDFAVVLSVGYETISSDQVALHIQDDGSGNAWWTLFQNSGLLTKNSSGFYAGQVSGETNIAPVVYGQTIEFVIGVKWATDSTGAVEVYYRIPSKTSAWTHALDRQNVPTYAYGTTSYGTINKDMSNEPTVLDKVGLYYGFFDGRTSFSSNTLYNYGFTRSADLATAQSTLP